MEFPSRLHLGSRHTIKQGMLEHGTLAEQRNTTEQWEDNRTPRNNSRTPRNTDGTTTQHEQNTPDEQNNTK